MTFDLSTSKWGHGSLLSNFSLLGPSIHDHGAIQIYLRTYIQTRDRHRDGQTERRRPSTLNALTHPIGARRNSRLCVARVVANSAKSWSRHLQRFFVC